MKTVIGSTQFDEDLDYDSVARLFSMMSESNVWFERNGDNVDILTDGDPVSVSGSIIKAARSAIENIVVGEMGVRKWERNARMN